MPTPTQWLSIYFSQGEEGHTDLEYMDKHGLPALVNLLLYGGAMPSEEEQGFLDWQDSEPWGPIDRTQWHDGILATWNEGIGYFGLCITRMRPQT